jgi:hypothetical protein
MEQNKLNGVSRPGEYKTRFLKECHYDFIFKWYTENLTVNISQLKRKSIEASVSQMPIKVIKNWQMRFKEAVDDLRRHKKDKMPEW